jgi:hypothetical protein
VKRAKKLHPPRAPRNPVARSPLMRKGGAHGKTRSAERRQANVALTKLVRDPKTFDDA